MSDYSWFDVEGSPLAWFDPELSPSAWLDPELDDCANGGRISGSQACQDGVIEAEQASSATAPARLSRPGNRAGLRERLLRARRTSGIDAVVSGCQAEQTGTIETDLFDWRAEEEEVIAAALAVLADERWL